MKTQKNKSNFSAQNVILRQILEKRWHKTFFLTSTVSIIKYSITHIHKSHMIYMPKKNSLHISFHFRFQTPQNISWLSARAKHSLKLSTNAPSLPRPATKTVILYSSKVTGAEVLLYSMLELSCQKASRFLKERTPMATRKHCAL